MSNPDVYHGGYSFWKNKKINDHRPMAFTPKQRQCLGIAFISLFWSGVVVVIYYFG